MFVLEDAVQIFRYVIFWPVCIFSKHDYFISANQLKHDSSTQCN